MDESIYKYNSWPLGQVPEHLQRPELRQLRENGYEFGDAREVVDMFEKKVAAFAGSKYAVAIDCCSHGIFLALKYIEKGYGENNPLKYAVFPKRTYISAPMQALHAGFEVRFEDTEWSGLYQIRNTRVIDGAVRWTKDMYVGGKTLQVVSFQMKKRIPIGKGGMILTDDEEAYKWLKLMCYDGRDLTTPYTDPNHVRLTGYHMYMTPEDAARGILLMDEVNRETEVHPDSGDHTNYTDASEIFKQLGHD